LKRRRNALHEDEITRHKSISCDREKNPDALFVELQNDHDEIREQIDLLRPSTTHFAVEDKPDLIFHLSHLQQLFSRHCLKEERMVFPLLASYLGPRTCEELFIQHDAISNLIDETLNRKNHDKAVPIARLDPVLRKHFYREENVLFWYLCTRLSAEAAIMEQITSVS
jgi:iron-sulfur cluster repair protein YtfE (RIC family)